MIDKFASSHIRADAACHVTQRQRVIEIHFRCCCSSNNLWTKEFRCRKLIMCVFVVVQFAFKFVLLFIISAFIYIFSKQYRNVLQCRFTATQRNGCRRGWCLRWLYQGSRRYSIASIEHPWILYELGIEQQSEWPLIESVRYTEIGRRIIWWRGNFHYSFSSMDEF